MLAYKEGSLLNRFSISVQLYPEAVACLHQDTGIDLQDKSIAFPTDEYLTSRGRDRERERERFTLTFNPLDRPVIASESGRFSRLSRLSLGIAPLWLRWSLAKAKKCFMNWRGSRYLHRVPPKVCVCCKGCLRLLTWKHLFFNRRWKLGKDRLKVSSGDGQLVTRVPARQTKNDRKE